LAEGRKQAVSLRLSAADIRRIKKLADRLGARDSDVVRFAIKMMLHRMLPLCDSAVRGRNLVPVLAEFGPETVQHFELDAAQLDEIVNGDAPADQRVHSEDIALLTLVSAQESYAKLSLRALTPPSKPPPVGDRRDASPVNAMRRHLYARYGFAAPGANGASGITGASGLSPAAEPPPAGAGNPSHAPATRARRKGPR
jgi:hypothetical protein